MSIAVKKLNNDLDLPVIKSGISNKEAHDAKHNDSFKDSYRKIQATMEQLTAHLDDKANQI